MPDPQEKKIIVDEDWKSQVQAEKEAAKQTQEQPEASREAVGEPPDVPLPPPTLASVVTMLTTQALFALGLVPRPDGQQPVLRLNEAKHLIDAIAMLEEKTEGNRTTEESDLFTTTLHELRMGYIAVQQQAGEGR